MAGVPPLSVEALCLKCDPEQFTFETTEELDDLEEVIGQERAVEAIDFGIGIRQEGYNLFAVGPLGTGKYTSVSRSLERRAAEDRVPDDWCYVYNFKQPHMPKALGLPAGQGAELQRDMDKLIEELFAVLPGAFESEEYHTRKRAIEAEFQEQQEQQLEDLRHEAERHDIALIRTPSGLAFAPLQDKEVIKPDDFMKLPDEQRTQIESRIETLQERLQKIIRQVPQWVRQSRSKVKELNEEVAGFAIAPLFDELKEKYASLPAVLAHLEAIQNDIIEHNDIFLQSDEEQSVPASAVLSPQRSKEAFSKRYRINVVVDNSESSGAPVVYEQNPTYPNLIGRLEHMAQLGALVTDFTLIKSGALHQANGGYLVLDARKLVMQPYAWEGIKRVLRSGEICIESPGQAYGLVSTVALQPEPIPLKVKVVLLGERMLYYLMHQNDPDFGELFKVMADFDDQLPRNDDNNMIYARLVGTLARKENLRHFNRGAVAKIIERSARMVGDSEKLSAHMQSVADLMREADYWAGDNGQDVVGVDHVTQAIEAQIRRASRIEERMQESILRETILIDTEGERVGQINGLSVLMLGNYAFGRPSRITARTRIGKGEVVDIERQVDLGGPLHSKGVLILSSYLGSRYAADKPLSLSASLVFEQSYGGVDGDSASSAELYALLSALSGVPIKQSLAVTGSVNQHGQVQAIGGVNEKIEGFFDICQARGLTGDQGVLIPKANVKHLMLNQDVIKAVEQGQFHVYAIETVEQGIEILTGLPAGEMDDEGKYPEGTINRLVIDRLEAMTETQRAFNRPPKKKDEETGSEETGEEETESEKTEEDES
jgi:lon-related putative ATP-dependent protease